MLRKGLTEKEKVLKRLTEREIKEQLYGFNARPYVAAPRAEEPEKPKAVKQEQPKPKIEKKIKPIKVKPDFVIQLAMFVIFLVLIWFSVRQIIKVVASGNARAKYESVQKAKQKPAAKTKINKRR
ncbi:MAG: hypothetical protein COW11_01275 [Candidatus Omnitrophica bacterium CG12_big_fil_rev_8_21_14_0_65_43_15]|uniref:Uncharacterized protein n=1 Tax=Candidatus Taenaricola geysiri TaxID=1974752 RepID=A0A2J0LG52_9BACT|nr:MAG: hypothetical protein AUJ89_02755 [Candidatus Omnitrophica bacterium CG1_02_43_210]PIV12428.1 MAG: hypothetical protein COS48_00785 [Candidatus Omnitrophica bacterium CG03_land_8_20_14_0_80_43_22]PIW66818.1 MAG: hypothetical protein COW11_01275 [Candidatus Omnitrophica bacterium CG12_big_fil_rev_8_21_14_0_65_43_15]PIW80417.1 MAG: hypothetical protein COZ98_02460 [Candidatus Omnitrophica bacterium CG_4_8_14_3_um_filter_43_15]PIY84677.1 MAG: hypothetical protein COY77_01195 [Candidatus Omn